VLQLLWLLLVLLLQQPRKTTTPRKTCLRGSTSSTALAFRH